MEQWKTVNFAEYGTFLKSDASAGNKQVGPSSLKEKSDNVEMSQEPRILLIAPFLKNISYRLCPQMSVFVILNHSLIVAL